MSYYQPSENNQDRRGNLKNRQGNYMLKCLSSEPLLQKTTSSFHVSGQEVISSKPLVQKVILDPKLMAGQRNTFPVMEFNQMKIFAYFWYLFSSSIEASSTYEFHQMHSERRIMISGHFWMFVYPHQGELCDDVTSIQYRVESYNMCQTGMGASLCLLIHLMASWPEYLSYCKCWPVSLNQLKDDEECSLSAPL